MIMTMILKAVGSIGATVIVGLTTALYTKLRKKIKESRISHFINEAVKSAEQQYPNTDGNKTGTQKYLYVFNETIKRFPELTDDPHLKTLIEAAVYEVSQQVKLIAKEQLNSTEHSIKVK